MKTKRTTFNERCQLVENMIEALRLTNSHVERHLPHCSKECPILKALLVVQMDAAQVALESFGD